LCSTTACSVSCKTPLLFCEQKHAETLEEVKTFKISDLQNQDIQLDYSESRYTLLHFWATWCTVCVHELVTLSNLARQFHENQLRVVSISLDSELDKIKSLIERHNLAGEFYMDTWDQARLLFDVDDVPQTVLINRTGELVSFPIPASAALGIKATGPQAWDDAKVVSELKAFTSQP
jgi:peroxiredoxin